MDIQHILGYGISAFTGRLRDDFFNCLYHKCLDEKTSSIADVRYRINCLDYIFQDIFEHACSVMQHNTALSNVLILVNTPEFYFRGTFDNDFYIAQNLQPNFYSEDSRPKYNARRETAINITRAISQRFQRIIAEAQYPHLTPSAHVKEFVVMVCAGTIPLTRGEKSRSGEYVRMDNFALFFSLHYILENGVWVCRADTGISETAISKREISGIDYLEPTVAGATFYSPKIKRHILLEEQNGKVFTPPESLMMSYPQFIWPETPYRFRGPLSVGVSICVDYADAKIAHELRAKGNPFFLNDIIFAPGSGLNISALIYNQKEIADLCRALYKGGIVIFADGAYDQNPTMYTLKVQETGPILVKVQEEIPIYPRPYSDPYNLFYWENDRIRNHVKRPMQAFYLGHVPLRT